MNGSWKRFTLGLLAAGCVGNSQAQTAVDAGSARPAKTWKLSQVSNLARVPGLRAAHKDLLARQGFFLAPQDPPPRGQAARPSERGFSEADPFPAMIAGGERTQATHLFHVYERNDYVRFPSFITADLAIDTTHVYFDAVLRDLEQHQLGPILTRALTEMVKEAEKVRAAAKTEPGRAAAQRTAVFWAVALRLQKDKAALPPALREATDKLVKTIVAGQGRLPIPILRADFDATQTRPRGHYTRNKELERFFRSMSWLGMAAFPVEGRQMDVEGVALLARAWLGSKVGRESLERVMKVTTFFVGGADGAGLAETAAVLKSQLPEAERAGADQLVDPDLQERLRRALVATLPVPRIAGARPDQVAAERQVRVLGRRAFEDAVAIQELLPLLPGIVGVQGVPQTIPPLMGARAAAAMLGSPAARGAILAGMPAAAYADVDEKLTEGREVVSAVVPERWSQDAYHGTLLALRTLLEPLPGKVPPLLATDAWRLRALQAFASGWAELRHDTLLYGEQQGAECDVEEMEPPPGWVEPVPELYRRLATMVRTLDQRLASAGLNAGFRPQVKPPAPDGERDPMEMANPPAEKTKLLLEFLNKLVKVAESELKGGKLDRETLTWMTTIGGTVEWILMTFSNSGMLDERDADMAVVADVFTWRPSQNVLEVGLARPDLIYAIIPSPKGPMLARGAIMSYREFMHPQATRMTDEEWRKQIAAGRTPARPTWLGPLYAEPPGPVRPPEVPQDRCGPTSGAHIECL